MTFSILIIITCLLLSAFFSGMEIAFLASNKLRIEIDNKSNKGITQTIIDLFVSNSGMYITTILVGNNVVMVIYGIFMSEFLIQKLSFLNMSVGVELLVQTLISTLIILFMAEFLPKTVFRLRPNMFLKVFAIPTFLFYLLFFPLSYFSVWFGGLLLRLFTGKKLGDKEPNRVFGKVDLNNLIEDDANCRVQEEEHEIKLFRNVLDFSEIKLRECIVARPDVVALSIDSSIEELTELFVKTGLSRILIYKESIDNIIGYVHISSLFREPPTIAKVLSKVLIVPGTMPAQRLLNLFIKDQKSIAVVVDEFGITAGIVTIEDIMEEIFGEIEDEHDHLNLKEVVVNEKEFIFSGRLEVDYINEKYHLNLEEREEYETLAGLILYFNESIPQEGELVEINEQTFKILSVKNARIEEVKVYT